MSAALINEFYRNSIIQHGNFVLKSGEKSEEKIEERSEDEKQEKSEEKG